MKVDKSEIKEWIDLLKKQVSEIYSIYRPVEGGLLYSVNAENIIQKMLDFALASESRQEATFYLQTAEKMIYQLVINHIDVMSINRTGESLRIITQAYEDFLRTYKRKRDIVAKTFQSLLILLTKDLPPSLAQNKTTDEKQTDSSLKQSFVNSIITLAEHFIKQTSEFRDDLRNIDHKTHHLTRKKLHKLDETAKNIKIIAEELALENAPVKIMSLISELRCEIKVFNKISQIHGLDLAVHSLQDIPAPISLERCMDTLQRTHSELNNALPSLFLTPEESESLLGLGLSGVGIYSQSGEALEILSQTIDYISQGSTSIKASGEIQESAEAKKYVKLGLYAVGGVSLVLLAVTLPAALPITLTGFTAAGYLQNVLGFGKQLLSSLKHQEQLKEAMTMVQVFFNSAEADLDSRLQQLIERRILKDDILAEEKNPKIYLEKVTSVVSEQLVFFSKSVMIGRETVIAGELRQVKGGELLMQGSNKPLHYKIISKLLEKRPEPGAVAKILNYPPRDCSLKLKQILDKEFEPKVLEIFTDRLYKYRKRMEAINEPRPSLTTDSTTILN